jgi:Cupin
VPLLLDATGTDVLADVLDSLKLRGRIFCRCELSAPWPSGFAAGQFSHFYVIERGRCWLRLQGKADATALEQGDLLLVTRGHGYQLSDEPTTPAIPVRELVGDSRGGLHAVLRHGGGGRAARMIRGAFEFGSPQAKSFRRCFPNGSACRSMSGVGTQWLDATVGFLARVRSSVPTWAPRRSSQA